MTPEPLDHADLSLRVTAALAAFLRRQGELLAAVSEGLRPVQDAAEEFLLQGGKRLRPAFCYWGWRGAGAADGEEVVRAAAALELLHACALIHDDLMDGSDTRRGRPAVHRRFATLHARSGWRGDSAGYGLSAAVLLGDLCLIWADEMLATSGLPPAAVLRGQPVYDRMRVELMAGQYLDLHEQAAGTGGVDSALRVARYKSAKYTVERPLHLGAALAGAGEQLAASYTAYGVPLGEAFQLRDDVLGVFGDPAETGKPAGDDLREGKRTALVALALEAASPVQRDLLLRHLGDPALSAQGVAEVQAVIRDTGALRGIEDLVSERVRLARTALQEAAVPEEARAALSRLALAATDRTG